MLKGNLDKSSPNAGYVMLMFYHLYDGKVQSLILLTRLSEFFILYFVVIKSKYTSHLCLILLVHFHSEPSGVREWAYWTFWIACQNSCTETWEVSKISFFWTSPKIIWLAFLAWSDCIAHMGLSGILSKEECSIGVQCFIIIHKFWLWQLVFGDFSVIKIVLALDSKNIT